MTNFILYLYFVDDRPAAHDINKYVVPNCSAKWRELGEALGMTSDQLDIITVDHPTSCEDRCKMMLRKWLDHNPSATWGKLIDAVDSSIVTVHNNTEGIVIQVLR